jgi:phage tail protein X
MLAAFGLLVWAGYGIASYGWVLVKGYDITMSSWFSPAGTFRWSANPGMVPQGQVFPSGAAGPGDVVGGSLGPVKPGGTAVVGGSLPLKTG